MKSKNLKKLILILLVFCFFISAVLIYYIQGYIIDNPKSCNTCHIMNDHYDSWEKSTHNKASTCNDCHISPKKNKYAEEIKIGCKHTINFLFGKYRKPLQISPESHSYVIENCYRCHTYLVYSRGLYIIHHKNAVACIECHSCGNSVPSCTSCHYKSSHYKN